MWSCSEWDLEASEVYLEVPGLVGVNTSWAGKDSKMLEDS